jgi:alpha-L-fucosidase
MAASQVKLWVAALCLAALAQAGGAPDERVRRYMGCKFGMFIHWGPYSLASVEASWPIMRPERKERGVISEAEYRLLPTRFNPVKFDPKAWIRLAREAGQRYMVFTSKHHDGFVMFDSAYTDYKITNTPYKKDLVGELAAACRAEGMPLGFYYSPPDMNHPGYRDTSKPASANWRGEPTRAEWVTYLDYMEVQVRELLTRYGELAVVWFDGLGGGAYDGLRFQKLVRELQPRAVMNNRIGIPGDFETPEQFIPKTVPTRPWETCMTINRTWAYNRNDTSYKPTTQLIRMLIEVASKGGNFLLNVGPTPEGTIQPEFEERLRGIGAWLKVNGEAIYGTTAGPLQDLPWGRTTAKGGTIYLHVFDWPKGTLEVPGLRARVRQVSLLAGGQRLRFAQRGDRLSVQTPEQAPDPQATVLVLHTR